MLVLMSFYDRAVALADQVRAGVLLDTRPDYLKQMTRDAPTTETYNFFLYCLTKELQPAHVVETGTDRGRSATHMAEGCPTARIVSIDIDVVCSDQLRAFNLPNVEAVTGNSLTLTSRFPAGSIDLLFLDSLHTYEHLKAEFAAFVPLVRSGGLVVLDDVALDAGMKRAWSEISLRKLDTGLHFSGFGLVEVP